MEAVPTCAKCKTPLIPENYGTARVPFNTGGLAPCPSCGTSTIIDVFPAMFDPVGNNRPGEMVVTAEEAACFYHPQKRASVPCDNCGRFLCALCDVELHGQHLCPSCLQSGKKKGRLKNLENERVLYDRIALALSTLPGATVFLTFIAAPIALFLSFRHWKSPRSLVRRFTSLRFLLAIIFSLLQIAGWVVVIAIQFRRH